VCRLNTILDYHRVLVMSDGVIAEWGTPDELRKKEGGIFSGMLAGEHNNRKPSVDRT
jgi:ABC-type multidrug transport system fused ATPase/permease subunit